MAGGQLFTSFSTGKESTAGTSVATTAEWYGDGTGELNIDRHLALHGGNRGTRTRVAHVTSMGTDVNITFNSDPEVGVAYNELHKLFGQLDGGNSGAGASADKTWTIAPSQTASNSPESYTIEIGDDIQYWEVAYCQVRDFTLSASADSMTNVSVNWFGRTPVKVTNTSLAANEYVRIPGYLWIPRFTTSQAGISGDSDSLGALRNWEATYHTGLVPKHTQSGVAYFYESGENEEQFVDMSFTLESSALAVEEYDKWLADSSTFMQLKATGPSLGDTAYSVTLQFALKYTQVDVIASEDEGVNLYNFTARSVLDSSWGTNMSAVIVNSLATIT